MMPLILASTSPRRADLLTLAHIAFDTLAVEVDETWQNNESATDYIARMVSDKAIKAGECLKSRPSCLVLTADTIGVLDGQVLTKPKDKADAFLMWHALSDRTHEVWTAVQASVISKGVIIKKQQIVCKTSVTFIKLTLDDMAYYWQTGEPCDKAGGYAIQGYGATWIRSITGSYSNVVGLPLAQTLSLIKNIS